jgi:hypothetical protein
MKTSVQWNWGMHTAMRSLGYSSEATCGREIPRLLKWSYMWEINPKEEARCLEATALFLPIVACPGWLWWWRIWWNAGKPKYSEKTRLSATLSTTNPTWPYPGSNPGRRCGEPATNRLSYGAAVSHSLIICLNILKKTHFWDSKDELVKYKSWMKKYQSHI